MTISPAAGQREAREKQNSAYGSTSDGPPANTRGAV